MHFFQRGDVKYGEKRTSFEVPQSRTKVLLKASPAAFALSTRDLLQCLCNFLGKVAIICATNLTSKVKNIIITSLKNCGLLCLFCPFGLLFSTWTIVQQCSKCKKKDKKKAKFFIIETGKLLFLTAYSTCQKMLTLWGQTIFFSRL